MQIYNIFSGLSNLIYSEAELLHEIRLTHLTFCLEEKSVVGETDLDRLLETATPLPH